MNNKVLVISFSFEQEPDAFQVLRDGGFEPVLWAQKDRGENTTEQALVEYWNRLEEKPRGILMGADVPVTDVFLEAAGVKPEAVSLNCAGYDHLELDALRKHGVKVCNVPRQNFSAVADLAFGLIIALMRKIPQGDRNIRAGQWAKGVERGMAVSGKTLGILGFGAVGRAVAKRGAGFEMNIITSDIFQDEQAAAQMGARFVDRETLFRQSDIFVVAAPATKETRHLVNGETLAMMKPGAVVINPSRGAVVDTGALVEALQKGTIAGAGLDVYEEEPLYDSPLFDMDNTVLTPHMGGLADREIRNVAMRAAQNMVALLTDENCGLGIV
ncbi:MAG: NAD(P)-dependent oxidoreductase [Candidatus Limiplasma sp.]|nr:NAD(P)-dependent oxidoreductase [Candidatus Limiplasma sp.]